MKFREFLEAAFSETKIVNNEPLRSPSSKRICAGIIILTVCFCTTWCGIKYGINEYLKPILETEVITACALLGVTKVTDIFMKK